jgi:magnesium chelatase family protein
LHQCTCTPGQIHHYRHRVSGPLLDRIDIYIEVPAVPYKELSNEYSGEKSEDIMKRVDAARGIQLERFKNDKKIFKWPDEDKAYKEVLQSPGGCTGTYRDCYA